MASDLQEEQKELADFIRAGRHIFYQKSNVTNDLGVEWLRRHLGDRYELVEIESRCPDPMPGEDAELEIRPVFEADDLGKEFTPELRAQEERLRAEVEKRNKS